MSPPTTSPAPSDLADAPLREGVRTGPFNRDLLRGVPESRAPVVALAALGALQGLVAIAQAIAVAALVVAVVRREPLGTIGVVTMALFVARGAVAAATELVGARAGVAVSGALRRRATLAVLGMPAGRRPSPAAVQTMLDHGATAVEPYVARYLPALVGAVVLPVAAILAMAWFDWRIALIPVLTVPLLPMFAALIGAATADETSRRWTAMEVLSGHYLDVMQGLVTLVNFGRARRQLATISRVSQRLRRATVATLRLAFMSAAALELLASISVAIVAVFVGLALADGRMDLAVGLPLILLAPEAYWPVRRVGTEFHAAADGAAALDQLLGLVAGAPDGIARDGGRPMPAATADVVVLDDLAIGHDDPLAVDLDVALGTGLTVVVGPSGVGKTTLLEVLAGVREPLAGHVVAPPAHLAGQRPFLVAGDLATNLGLASRPAPDAAAVRAALAAVELADVVAALPHGLATRVGDDGIGLSAGQRTRMALARALLAQESFVLLDEPTAHLDDRAGALVRDVVRAMATERTVVVASHDPAVVAMADHVIDLAAHRPPAPDDVDGATTARVRPMAAVDDARPAPDPVPPGDETVTGEVDDATLTQVSWDWQVMGSGVIGGLARACGVALTATSGWLIVSASLEPEILVLLVAIVLVRAFGIARPVLRWWERVRSHDHALADLARRRTGLWARLVPLAPARLGAHGRSRLLSGLVDDLDDVVSAQVRVVVPTVAIAVAGLVGVLVAWWALPAAVLPLLAVLAGIVVVAGVDVGLERRAQSAVVAARTRVSEVVTVAATGATAIRGLGPAAVGHLDDRLRGVQDRLAAAVARQSRGRATGIGLVPVVVGAGTLAIAAVAGGAIDTGLGTPMVALVVLVPLGLGEAIGADLAAAAGEWARARAAARRLAEVLAQEPAVTDPEHPVALTDQVRGRPVALDLVDAAARWSPDRPAVALPDLHLGPGSHVGLVGANGSGKSTTLAVLARHLDLRSGRYECCGAEVGTLALRDVRARFAIVDDEPHVFASTLRENLRLAAPAATDDGLVDALATAGLGTWFGELPDGLDTRLGAGGRGVSGGERTRLAVARAVVSGRPVILLDEPVAHLDHPTAVALMRDVATAFADRAMVVGMHRPEGMDALDVVVRLVAREASPRAPGAPLTGRASEHASGHAVAHGMDRSST